MNDKKKMLELNEDALDQVSGGNASQTVELKVGGTHLCSACNQTKAGVFYWTIGVGIDIYICEDCKKKNSGDVAAIVERI